MTKKQIYELVRMTHPTAPIAEINIWINTAMDDMLRFSGYNKVNTTITSIASTLSYALDSTYIDISEVKIGADVLSRIVGDVNVGEEDGLEQDRYYYWLFDNKIYLVKGGDTTSYVEADLSVIVTATKKEADVTLSVELPTDYPACFYEGIIAKVTSSLFGRGSGMNLKAMSFFDEKYRYAKKMLRKDAFIRKNSSNRTIVQYSY